MISQNDILDISYKIDRKKYKLDNNCLRKIVHIKKKLNIPIQKNFNTNEVYVSDIISTSKLIDGSLDKVIGDLKINLNKITEKTYNKIYDKIKIIINNYNSSDFFKEVVNVIFNITTKNRLNSKIFARLYKDLNDENSYFEDILKNELESFHLSFEKIKYVSPNENYDKFCDYIKENENKVNLSLFFLECYKNNLILLDNVEKIVKSCIHLFLDNISYSNNYNICEELINNIYILLKGLIEENTKNKNMKQTKKIINDILFDINLDSLKNEKSFNNKIKFKVMDIQDFIKVL